MQEVTLATADHRGEAGAGGVDMRHHMHLPVSLPHVIGAGGRPVIALIEVEDAGVGAKQIDLPKGCFSLGHHGCHRRLITDIQ